MMTFGTCEPSAPPIPQPPEAHPPGIAIWPENIPDAELPQIYPELFDPRAYIGAKPLTVAARQGDTWTIELVTANQAPTSPMEQVALLAFRAWGHAEDGNKDTAISEAREALRQLDQLPDFPRKHETKAVLEKIVTG